MSVSVNTPRSVSRDDLSNLPYSSRVKTLSSDTRRCFVKINPLSERNDLKSIFNKYPLFSICINDTLLLLILCICLVLYAEYSGGAGVTKANVVI